MAKVRNISDDELHLPHLDRVVQRDEVIEVPDPEPFLTGEIDSAGKPVSRTPAISEIWPESIWAEVATTKKKADA